MSENVLDVICSIFFSFFLFFVIFITLLTFILVVLGGLIGIIYWVWSYIKENTLGKKDGGTQPSTRQDYSIDQSKPI